MSDDENKGRGEHWAEVAGLLVILAFIFGLVYLAHNGWHF